MADDQMRLRAELDGALERDVRSAARAVDELGDEAEGTAMQLAAMDLAARGAGRATRDMGDDAGRSRREIDEMGKSSRRTSKDHDELGGALGRLQGWLKKIKGGGFDFGAVLKAYKIPAIVTAVTLLSTVVSALGAAGIAGVAGLAPLGALLVGMPAAYGAAAQAMLAFKLGTEGVANAVKVLTTPGASPDQITKAMEKLSPAARGLAKELAAFSDGPLKRMRDSTGRAIAPGLLAGLRSVRGIMPEVNRGMFSMGAALGSVARDAGKATKSPVFRGELGRVMQTNAAATRNAGTAGIFLVRTLLHLVDAFRPVLLQMSQAAVAGARYVESATRAGHQTGALAAFFQRAWNLAKGFGAVVRDLAVGLFNVGRASGVMSNFLGGALQRGAAGFRAWTESTKGQAGLRKYFSDAVPVVKEVIRLIGAIAVAFGGLATNKEIVPVLAQIRTQLLPAIQELAGGVTTAFGPALVQAATAFVEFNNALTFSPLATILNVVAKAVTAIAEAVSAAPEPLRTMLASVLALSLGMKVASGGLGLMAKSFSPLVEVAGGFTGKIDAAAKGASGFAKVGAKASTQWGLFRQGMVDSTAASSAFSGVAGTLGGKTSALTSKLMGMRFVGPLLTGIGTAARVMWAGITGPVGLVIAAIVAVIAVGVLLYKKWTPFRELVDYIWGSIKTGAVQAWNAIVVGATWVWGILKQIWSDISSVAIPVWNAIKTAAQTVWHAIQWGAGIAFGVIKAIFAAFVGYARFVWSIISTAAKIAFAIIGTIVMTWWTFYAKPIFTAVVAVARGAWNLIVAGARIMGAFLGAVWNRIKAAAQVMGNALRAVWARVKAAFVAFFSPIAALAVAIWNRVSAGAQVLWGRLRAIFAQIRSVASAAWNFVASAARSAWSRVTGIVSGVWGRIRGIFSSIRGAVSNLWGGLTSGLSAAVGGVQRALGAIKGAVNSVIRGFNRLPGPDLPMLFTGGPTTTGMRAMVGELGPEAWVKASGAVEIIGKSGPEVRRFDSPGFVVPNHVLAAMRPPKAADPKEATPIRWELPGADDAPPPPPPGPRGPGGGDEPPPPIMVTVDARGSNLTEAQVKAAAKAGAAEGLREYEERKIHHGWTAP